VLVALLETLDIAAELVAEELADEAAAVAAAAAVDVELEWLLEPQAATSSAGASARPIRLRIGSG
jgi:hypothetical protein